MENIGKKRVIQCLIIAGVSILLLLIGATIIPCFDGGCALMFVSIFLFFASLAVAGILFYPMSKAFDAVIKDTDILAHWTYDPSSYSRILDREYKDHIERNTGLLIIIDGIILVSVIILIVFVPDGGFETAMFMLVVAALLFVVAKVAPGYFRGRKEKMPPEAWISRKGLIYEGAVYPYSGFMYGCNGVYYREGKEPAIVFDFFQITGARIYDPFEIAVPVPPGEEEKAKKITDELFPES